MGTNLTAQVRNIAEVTTAVARGDLSRKITVDVKGEILELKNTINTMVDQLRVFAAEVTRVAREVGTEGKLGGQADVPGVAGTWKDLTDSVNVMAANLTDQVRGIVKVVTAVANGNLRQKLTVEAKGEVAALAETINNMTDTLATFAEQVTNVAREVGVEGRLGGQANVPGAAGTWKDLTGNVNLLAANLTNQVRAIAEVATAVTKGDLTRSIQVEARGEVAELKDNINTMIDNLRGDDRSQPGAGLAEDEPRASSPACCRASATSSPSARCCSPSWRRWSTRSRARSTRCDRSDAERRARRALRAARRLRAAATISRAHRARRRPRRPVRAARSSASCSTTCRPTTRKIHSSLGGGAAEEHRRAAGAVRRARRWRSSSWPSLRPFTNTHLAVPRPAHAVDRRRAQHHRGDDAHREPAAAVAAADDGAADAADRAAADQRGAGLEGQAARRAERGGRAQEQGSRAGAPRARRKGGRAGAHVASTSRSSWPTCRTSCARRSTRS